VFRRAKHFSMVYAWGMDNDEYGEQAGHGLDQRCLHCTYCSPAPPHEGWMTLNDGQEGRGLENGEDGEQLNLPFICCSSPQSSSLPFFIFCCSPKSPPPKRAHTCPKRHLNPSRTRLVQPVYTVFWPFLAN
jgi:hypothetical protein